MGSSDRTSEGGIFNYLLLLRRWLLHFRQRVTFEPIYLLLYPTWHDTSSLQRGSGTGNDHRAIPLSVTPERLPPLIELPHPALPSYSARPPFLPSNCPSFLLCSSGIFSPSPHTSNVASWHVVKWQEAGCRSSCR